MFIFLERFSSSFSTENYELFPRDSSSFFSLSMFSNDHRIHLNKHSGKNRLFFLPLTRIQLVLFSRVYVSTCHFERTKRRKKSQVDSTATVIARLLRMSFAPSFLFHSRSVLILFFIIIDNNNKHFKCENRPVSSV